jgi:hypothetical protein
MISDPSIINKRRERRERTGAPGTDAFFYVPTEVGLPLFLRNPAELDPRQKRGHDRLIASPPARSWRYG